MNNNANIIFESVRGFEAIPIDDVFLRERKLFLVGEVSDESCDNLIKKLFYLETQDNTKPVILYINSPGGDVTSGLAVYDTIRLMKSPVTAVITGIAASMGSIIFLACDKDKRLMLPSSKVTMCIQSFTQLESLYTHEQALTIINNCDHIIYLGSNDLSSAEFIGTRALKTPEIILAMDRTKEYLIEGGKPAVLVDKIPPYSYKDTEVTLA